MSHRKIVPLVLCSVIATLAVGCMGSFYNAPVKPPSGILFTKVSAPLTPDANGINVRDAALRSSATETMYIWEPILGTSWGFGDAAIEAAVRQHSNEEIAYADLEYLNVLGIYQSLKVNVYSRDKIETEDLE